MFNIKMYIIVKFFTFILFQSISNYALHDKLSLEELKSILSKKDSRSWIDSLHQTNISSNYNPYCDLCCLKIQDEIVAKTCGSHTLCKYPTNNTGPACKGYILMHFSQIEKGAIVDAHNTIRNTVASGKQLKGASSVPPTAANMRVIQWNNELTSIAERWAAQCTFDHDVCRDVDRFPVGQNIAEGDPATTNELSFIKEWYDAEENFNKEEIIHFRMQNNLQTQTYTQLVWADTYQIGCARAIFQRSMGADVHYREHFICNYGPSGNIPNQPVYKIGPSCSLCPEGTSCSVDYNALCGNELSKRPKMQSDLKLKKSAKGSFGFQLNRSSISKFKCYFLIFYNIHVFTIIFK